MWMVQFQEEIPLSLLMKEMSQLNPLSAYLEFCREKIFQKIFENLNSNFQEIFFQGIFQEPPKTQQTWT